MHSNRAFHDRTPEENLAFAAGRGFGMLVANGAEGPIAAHVPFVIEGAAAMLHLSRANPLCLADAPMPALLAVTGPDAYISPDWYGTPDQVPTWNYVAVHLRGRLHPLPPDALHDHLVALSARFEAGLTPKTPWKMDKMTPAVRARMMRAIQSFRLEILQVDGTWKLNQNKTPAQRQGAAAALEAQGQLGLAALMKALGAGNA